MPKIMERLCTLESKQEDDIKFESLDDDFCKGMDSSGPASWDKLLREMEQNSLVDVGTMNYREGVREEKWGMLDLKECAIPKADDSVCQAGDFAPVL